MLARGGLGDRNADWTGAQIGNNDSALKSLRALALVPVLSFLIDSDDIKNVDLTKIHNLSGPIAVEGAEPGDCLVVDILDGTIPSILRFEITVPISMNTSQSDLLTRCLGDIQYVNLYERLRNV